MRATFAIAVLAGASFWTASSKSWRSAANASTMFWAHGARTLEGLVVAQGRRGIHCLALGVNGCRNCSTPRNRFVACYIVFGVALFLKLCLAPLGCPADGPGLFVGSPVPSAEVQHRSRHSAHMRARVAPPNASGHERGTLYLVSKSAHVFEAPSLRRSTGFAAPRQALAWLRREGPRKEAPVGVPGIAGIDEKLAGVFAMRAITVHIVSC